jgi:hypothetical protein
MKNKNKKFNHKIKVAKVSFTGSKLTAFAGLTGVFKYIRNNKLFKTFNKLFPTIVSNATQYSNAQLMLLMVCSSLCKINRLSKIETFSADPLVNSGLNLNNKVSDSTLAERFTQMGEETARKLEEHILRENKEFLSKQNLERITMDLDSTVQTVYGNQEGAEVGYNPHKKGAKSYHPLLGFISDYKLVMHTWFRSGDTYTSNGTVEFIKQILVHTPKNIKELFFRMDSGFFDNQTIQYIEDTGHKYLIKVKLKGLKELLKFQDWHKEDDRVSTCEFDYVFKIDNEQGKKIHVARTLRGLRIVTKHEKGSMGEDIIEYEYFCYCSNLQGKTTMEIHDLYKQRAESENWIEQVKNQLLAGKTIVDDFWANHLFWQLSVYAYNLSIRMRIKVKKWWQQEYNTFRDWFISVPGKIIQSGHEIILSIYEHYIYKQRWEQFYALIQ